ncbi:MAG TPA: UDP-glucose/GDP-mannose dehydrogenase family protein, partial [Chloroflexota bacterium]|nr:UDP-glucose/GDP-mannose dehydrogenase family protein [Chloroflexota bacterium]
MANICIVGGGGYVGLTTGACFADLGNSVVCLDVNREKVANLQAGLLPIYEPGLEEIVVRNRDAGRLRFTTSYEDALAEAEFAFITVDTPPDPDGSADLLHLRQASLAIARAMHQPLIIVNKSTVPVGAGDLVTEIVSHNRTVLAPFSVVSNPEFLREGSALHDCLHPDRIILGSDEPATAYRVAELYKALQAPVVVTDRRTAEMIKYASNSFLATKISFINEIAAICEKLGADVKQVAHGMGLDPRIGRSFLEAGLGWGGSCFPKDVRALEYMAASNGCHPQLLRSVVDINRDQRLHLVQKIRDVMGGSLNGRTIGVLGLAFKPNTDDMREAPSFTIINQLVDQGAHVKAYDPVAMKNAQKLLPHLTCAANPYDVAEGADALAVLTEWNEFKQLDFPRVREVMAQPIIIDGRNVYDPR